MVNAGILLMFPVLLAAQQSVSPVVSSRVEDTFYAYSPEGTITLRAADLKLDVTYEDGRQERCNLLVVYDPEHHHYYWRYKGGGFLGPFCSVPDLPRPKSKPEPIYGDASGLYVFEYPYGRVGPNPNALWVTEYTSRADSLDESVKASIDEIRRGLKRFARESFHQSYQIIDLRYVMPNDFFCQSGNSFCPPIPNAGISLAKQDGNWRVMLRARYEIEVILDQALQLVRAGMVTHARE